MICQAKVVSNPRRIRAAILFSVNLRSGHNAEAWWLRNRGRILENQTPSDLIEDTARDKLLPALHEESQTIESSLDAYGILHTAPSQSKRSGQFFGSQAHSKGILFVSYIVLPGMENTKMTEDKQP